uniref:Uncharacterized protein n=1 Tax=Arundo donax TaxID=35708 RepID=A0A0A9ALX0_ARUDO
MAEAPALQCGDEPRNRLPIAQALPTARMLLK